MSTRPAMGTASPERPRSRATGGTPSQRSCAGSPRRRTTMPPPWPYRYRRRPVVVDIDGGATHRETMSPGHRLFLASGTTALAQCSPSRFSSRRRFGATRRIVLPHQFEQSGPRACHLPEVHPRHEQCVDLPPLSSTPDIFTFNYLLI